MNNTYISQVNEHSSIFSAVPVLFPLFMNSFRIFLSYYRYQGTLMMTVLIVMVHLLGFCLLSTALAGGWMMERVIRKEPDWIQKKLSLTIARKFWQLSPISFFVIFVTGVGNVIQIYGTSFISVYSMGWITAKIIFFACMMVNGTVLGPILFRKRTKLIYALFEQTAPSDAEATIKVYNNNLTTYYLVQTLLLLLIVFISVFGSGVHHDMF